MSYGSKIRDVGKSACNLYFSKGPALVFAGFGAYQNSSICAKNEYHTERLRYINDSTRNYALRGKKAKYVDCCVHGVVGSVGGSILGLTLWATLPFTPLGIGIPTQIMIKEIMAEAHVSIMKKYLKSRGYE